MRCAGANAIVEKRPQKTGSFGNGHPTEYKKRSGIAHGWRLGEQQNKRKRVVCVCVVLRAGRTDPTLASLLLPMLQTLLVSSGDGEKAP